MSPIPTDEFAEMRRKARAEKAARRKAENGSEYGPKYAPEWHKYLKRTLKGKIVSNFFNACVVLEHDPMLNRCFAYDEMQRCITRMHSFGVPEETIDPLPITDIDEHKVQRYIQATVLQDIGLESASHAIGIQAEKNSYHPVREYLDSLTWDGISRVNGWLSVYLGAELTEYTLAIGQMFLISMVARILKPGCKVDCMLVLEGPQGSLKSTVCSLLGGKYYSDCLPDITSGKDVAMHIRGRWLIEVPELHAFNRAEASLLKSFLSRPIERYRPPYGHHEVHEPRQCVIVGTTNKSVYLTDETGDRRSWSIRCGNIAIDLLRDNRDQLFAEAVKMYREGIRWYPDGDIQTRVFAPEQDARFEIDAWEEPIRLWLKSEVSVSLIQVARGCLDFEKIDKFSRYDQRRISAILTRIGWERQEKLLDGRAQWKRVKSKYKEGEVGWKGDEKKL